MARNVIKSISSKPEKFIPSSHKEDPDLNESNEDILKRPLVFYVKKMSRDEHFKIREMLEFKDDLNPGRGLRGSGDVAKYIWENNVIEVRNVVVKEGDTVATLESVAGTEKNALWNTEGMDLEINEAILFARAASMLGEAEAKN